MAPDAARMPDDLLAHAAFVRALAHAALRGDVECEDVAQDAWVAGLQRAPAAPKHRRSWFARVIRHRAIDLLRGRRRRTAREHAAARPEGTGSTFDAVERAETGRRLVAAVLVLDEPFRSAVLLRFLDGLSPRAVAQRLGVPVETVRSRVRRGLERLREALEEREGRSWRRGLAALGSPSLAWGTGALLLGGAAMKKALVAVAALVLLAGGGWWAFEGTGDRSGDHPAAESALDPSQAPSAAGPRLEGAPVARPLEPPAGPLAKIPDAVAPPRRVHGRVVGEDGTPIAGARLWEVSYANDPLNRITQEYRGVQAFGETDAEGRFDLAITESWSNGLKVRVKAEGWCLPDVSHLAGTVTLTNTKENVVTLVRGVPLTVWVLDDATGRPIAGADVAVYTSRGHVLYTSRAMTEGVTGADGTAEIRVPGGDLRVVAGATGYAQREGDGVNVGPEGARVTVRLERGGTLEGLVVDPEGRPVAGARVGLLRAPAVHLRSVTDAQGRFRFEHVPASGASEPDVPALRLTLVVVDAEGFLRTFSAGDSPPERGSATRRVAMLLPQVLLGRARYADGSPASDVQLFAGTTVGEPSWGWSVTMNAARARTGPDGSFRLEGIVPGSVALRLASRLDGEPLVHVQVAAEGTTPAVDLVLERELAPVHVEVRDAAGRPVRAAAVGLTPTGGRGGPRSGGQEQTDAQGRVSLTPSAPGPWWLYVDAPGAGPLARRVEAAEAQAGPIEVRPGDGVVEGRAERLDGRPARVRLALLWVFQEGNSSTMGAGWQGAVETDAQGRFRFTGVHHNVNGLRAVTSGMRVIPAVIPGFSPRARDLRVVVLDDAEAARLRIDVDVLDDVEHKPLTAVSVMVQREGQTSSWPLHAVREVAGRFRSPEPLEPGTWTVRVAAAGYVPAETEVVQPRTGGLQPVRVLLRREP